MGWLGFHRPIASPLDTKAARFLFSQWQELVRLYEDSGYLTYLKHGGGQMECEPGWALMREIRTYGTGSGLDSQEERLKGHFLLHMAQELDQQRREIREDLLNLGKWEKDLARQMGVESEDEEGFPQGSLPSPEEDDFLIPQRLKAWAELFSAWDEKEKVLLTTNKVAVEYLVERAMETKKERGHIGAFPLMELKMPFFFSLCSEATGKMRTILKEVSPWVSFCHELKDLLGEATIISLESQMKTRVPKLRALESYFHQEVKEPLIQKLAFIDTQGKGGWTETNMSFLLIQEGSLLGMAKGEEGQEGQLVLVHLEEK